MRVAHLPHGRRIDQIDMAGNERGERLFGLAGDIIPHECHVVVDHSPNTWTPDRKGNSLFFGGKMDATGRAKISPVILRNIAENKYLLDVVELNHRPRLLLTH